jgi:hypothetical protein
LQLWNLSINFNSIKFGVNKAVEVKTNLLSKDWTCEDGMVSAAGPEVDLDGKLVLGAPDSRNLTLVHHLMKSKIKYQS